jgi:uncharacterized Zn finger protein
MTQNECPACGAEEIGEELMFGEEMNVCEVCGYAWRK